MMPQVEIYLIWLIVLHVFDVQLHFNTVNFVVVVVKHFVTIVTVFVHL